MQSTHTRLVAVSKTKPIEQIMPLYEAGQRHFGENKVQEMVDKHSEMPKDIAWHMIGHLQKNKVKYIAPFVHLIHTVDSLGLLVEINKQALKWDRTIPVLLQFKIAQEDSKYGYDLATAIGDLTNPIFHDLDNVSIMGVMGMASFVEDEKQIRNEFAQLKNIFDYIKEHYFLDSPDFQEISMGMSGDYNLAIREGSTMVRIGSLLFGARN